MSCTHINEKLDDYIDGVLAEPETALLAEHVASCDSCRLSVEREWRLRGLLRDYPVPAPDAAFFEQVIAKAVHVSSMRKRKRRIMTGFSGAIAAGVIAWLIGGMWLTTADFPEPAGTIAGVTMSLEVPRTINLIFSSASELDDAVLTVSLPPGLEIEGLAGQREITWKTSLRAGKNILPLTLIATTPHGGELLARLEHDNRDRTFRIHVTVT